jgi:hypothetical protein
MAERPLGKNQRNLLGKLAGIWMALVVGDKLSASLVKRGLLMAEADGQWAHITPTGLRLVADEMEAGRLKGFSIRKGGDG